MTIKKLIEVALPLEAINAAAAREKSIRHGHPSTLHLWWARRPLAAARAVIWSSLVDDPSSHPELFQTEEEQKKERKRLFRILEELVVWENSNNKEILNKAKKEIIKYTNDKLPLFLDPFSGGGSIPLEAQRLGLEVHAQDLNPVAVMINKAMIEIPPKLADMPPINPISNSNIIDVTYNGLRGLSADVKYYGNLLKEKVFEKIGFLYPKAKIPKELGGGEAVVIAWIWARTVKCPNPACACEMPLVSSFVLSRKKGKEVWIEPQISEGKIAYKVKYGKCPKDKESAKIARGGSFKCVACGSVTDKQYIHDEFVGKRDGSVLIAMVSEGKNGRIYLSPDYEQSKIALLAKPEWKPTENMNINTPDLVSGRGYGISEWNELFTNRQLSALTTLCDTLLDIKKIIDNDYSCKKNSLVIPEDYYSKAVCLYLSFVIDKLADRCSAFCSWDASRDGIRNTYGRQAIPMVWDYAESNPFSNSSGCIDNMLEWIVECIENSPNADFCGKAYQYDAQSDFNLDSVMISTDPPYYDNIAYADLSDFFYVWLKHNLRDIYPEEFKTLLVPKEKELVANDYRFYGDSSKAKLFFEEGMYKACQQMYKSAFEEIPVTIYYAYKQSEKENNRNNEMVASSGWETMLSAIIKAGFSITGTWPINTEMANRQISMNTNALASSIVLVCRKRNIDAKICSRRNFVIELKQALKIALKNLQESNLAPVDLAQSAIGPGIGIFSKYSKVLEADGKPMSVRSALQIINNEIDLYFNGQDEDLDKESRFCVELYTQYGFDSLKYGDAETLSKAKNASIASLTDDGILFAEKGVVHLVDRSELKWPKEINARKTGIWLWAQLLTKELAENGIDGTSKLAGYISSYDSSDKAEKAKALVYRLYTIAEHKNWAKEAYAYNSLVITWPQILASSSNKIVKQQTFLF